jgi:hypothetical protein
MFATPVDIICAKVFPSAFFPYTFGEIRKVLWLIFNTNSEFPCFKAGVYTEDNSS